tara:strand:+ start:482 stop:649 length:168 start_codon:yes stop_codon:yes gene_type:complete
MMRGACLKILQPDGEHLFYLLHGISGGEKNNAVIDVYYSTAPRYQNLIASYDCAD